MRPWILLLTAGIAGIWFATGCGGAGAPTGGSSSPIPIELPHQFDLVTFDTGILQ